MCDCTGPLFLDGYLFELVLGVVMRPDSLLSVEQRGACVVCQAGSGGDL